MHIISWQLSKWASINKVLLTLRLMRSELLLCQPLLCRYAAVRTSSLRQLVFKCRYFQWQSWKEKSFFMLLYAATFARSRSIWSLHSKLRKLRFCCFFPDAKIFQMWQALLRLLVSSIMSTATSNTSFVFRCGECIFGLAICLTSAIRMFV